VLDFVKISSVVDLDPKNGKILSHSAAEIARAETLTAHASAAEFRAQKEKR
jgi:histidinol dehydrogenase